jgi:hypothetical protein
MRKRIFFVALLLGGLMWIGALYALEILVDAVEGDVEVKSGGGGWATAQQGMKLAAGDRVSTGFDSRAVLKFEDNSVVTVKPLTQLTIDRFLKDEAAMRTDVAVKIGEIRAQVEHRKDLKSDFAVITPTSVVSVRGTDEAVGVSDRGTDVDIADGKVQAENERNQPTQVSGGQGASVAPDTQITAPIERAVQDSRTDTVTNLGLTNEEVGITEIYSNPTTDPGGATTGQLAPTETKPPPPPPPPPEPESH